MKILSKNYKKNYVRMKTETLDDLWYLSQIIEEGDIIKSKSFRKIKLGRDDERSTKVVKKAYLLSIKVEKVEFAKYSNVLRVTGKIIEGPEDVSLGSYHTINIDDAKDFSIQKEHFHKYQIKKLEEAAHDKQEDVLIVVHDREEAFFAMLKKYGYENVGSISGNVTKKADVDQQTSDFFPYLKKTIKEYDDRYDFHRIVIASPGFWREYVEKLITEEHLKKKIVYATCSSVGTSGINEVVKRPEVQKVLKEEKFASEMEKIEVLLKEIATQGKVDYGLDHVKKAAEAGAIEELMVTDGYIHKMRQADNFGVVEYVMRKVEQMDGEVHLVSSEHEGGRKLDGLGGIAALLRYKLNW